MNINRRKGEKKKEIRRNGQKRGALETIHKKKRKKEKRDGKKRRKGFMQMKKGRGKEKEKAEK